MVSTLEQMQEQDKSSDIEQQPPFGDRKIPNGTGPGVRRSKHPLLASRTRCNVLWKPPKFCNKVKIGN